jgi:DNA-binding XRE family transcriptional regulator
MGRRKPASYHIRRLSRALAVRRRATGLTQVEAAQKIGICDKKLSRIETGQLPELIVLRAQFDLYGLLVEECQEYEDIWDLATAPYWWDGLGRDDVVYLSMEHEACVIRDFRTTHLSVLLQTDDYFERLLETSALPPSAERLEKELAAQHFRRRRLDEHPVTLHFLIYEPALHAGLGRAQLTHLLRRSEQDNVTIQIVPRQHPPLGVAHSSFTLLSFPDKDEPDLAYTQDPIGDRQTQDPQTVATITRTFRLLATNHAMTAENSHAYLKRLLDEVYEGRPPCCPNLLTHT